MGNTPTNSSPGKQQESTYSRETRTHSSPSKQQESGYNKSKPAQPEEQSITTNTDDDEGDDDGDEEEEAQSAPNTDNDDEPQPRIIHILETRFMQNQPNPYLKIRLPFEKHFSLQNPRIV